MTSKEAVERMNIGISDLTGSTEVYLYVSAKNDPQTALSKKNITKGFPAAIRQYIGDNQELELTGPNGETVTFICKVRERT